MPLQMLKHLYNHTLPSLLPFVRASNLRHGFASPRRQVSFGHVVFYLITMIVKTYYCLQCLLFLNVSTPLMVLRWSVTIAAPTACILNFCNFYLWDILRSIVGIVTSLWTLMVVCWMDGWLAGQFMKCTYHLTIVHLPIIPICYCYDNYKK